MKNKKLKNYLSILYGFAHEYAVAGGSRGIEMEIYNDCIKIIEEEIQKLEEYKWKYKELEK